MLRRFAPDDDGLGEAEIMCASRAREAAASVRERYAYAVTVPSDHPSADQDNETAESVIAKKAPAGFGQRGQISGLGGLVA